jgi:hypothetical protein
MYSYPKKKPSDSRHRDVVFLRADKNIPNSIEEHTELHMGRRIIIDRINDVFINKGGR